MSLLYVAITNEKQIVCQYAVAKRDLSASVHNYLRQSPPEGHQHYLEPNLGIHALNVSGISFLAITTIPTPRQQCIQFLIKLAEQFASSSTRVQQAKQGPADCLQHSYGSTLKSMALSFDSYKGNEQMTALQSNVEGVTNQLRENVQELMRRGEMATQLADKTANLESEARMFETYSRKVEQKKRYENLRMKFIIIGVIVLIITAIVLIILWQCGAFKSN